MDKIINYFRKNNGYARMRELKLEGFPTREIKRLLQEGKLEKIKAGLYKLPFTAGENFSHPSFVDISVAFPKSVICLLSAAEYHELTTQNPSTIYAAIPKSVKPPKIIYPPTKFFFWTENAYKTGIMEITTRVGKIKIYDKEKTICDLFRYRNKLGEDVAIEALKTYLLSTNFNLHKLREYSKILNVQKVITPFIKTIVG